MADRGDAEILEVVGCQIGQELGIDVILAECRLVSFKTERLAANPRRPLPLLGPVGLPIKAWLC